MDSLVLSSIVVKPASSKLIYTPAIDGEIKATTWTIEDPFTEESINVKDTLDSKQSTLTPFSNLSINKVSTLSDITAGGNLLYMDNNGTKNVKTEFSSINSAINNKQNQINS